MTAAEFQSIRERCGHNRQSLAAWLRVTPRTVQQIEAGDREPSGPIVVLMELLEGGKI